VLVFHFLLISYLGLGKRWIIPGKGALKVFLTDSVSEFYGQQLQPIKDTQVLQFYTHPFNTIDSTIMIYIGPPLWSSGQSSWLQIQRSGFYPGATRFTEK
jgi:hypothetical protein